MISREGLLATHGQTKAITGLGTLVLLLAIMLLPHTSRADTEKWKSDIDFMVSKIESIHPRPWYRISENDFKDLVRKLKADLPGLEEERIIVRMMQLVARLQDGHTTLLPVGFAKFADWYPVRVDYFADGYFITAVSKEYENLLGCRVSRIGEVKAEKVFERVASVASADSRAAWPRVVVPFFPNAAILRALGIVPGNELPLEVETRDQRHFETRIPAVGWRADFGWARWGFRAPGGREYVGVYDTLSGRGEDLPLHLRYLRNTRYWFEFLPEHKALYMQFNSVTDDPNESFAQFTDRLWRFCDEHSEDIGTFILDLRYNPGGSGRLLAPFIHGLIRQNKINQRGKLYCIVGPGTFSAATNCLGQMVEHTNVIVVGEATSGPLNWCSDTQEFELPSSGLSLNVSTLYWQGGDASDTRGYCPPGYTVRVTAADLFDGRDRALEAILAGEVRTLDDILRAEGAKAFLAEYEKRQSTFSDLEWWYPFAEYDLELLGYEMLLDKRYEDAIAAFRLNTIRHPGSWVVWRDLADCHREMGDTKEAIRCYDSSLALNPDNMYVVRDWRQLRLLEACNHDGWTGALDFCREIKSQHPRAFDEGEINSLGYASLHGGRTEEAICLLRINTEMHPESSNVWDSYAEAYMIHGEPDKAVQYYKKSLELNPQNTNAQAMIEKLLK